MVDETRVVGSGDTALVKSDKPIGKWDDAGFTVLSL